MIETHGFPLKLSLKDAFITDKGIAPARFLLRGKYETRNHQGISPGDNRVRADEQYGANRKIFQRSRYFHYSNNKCELRRPVRVLASAIFLICTSFTVNAGTSNQRAEKEARSFLIPCAEKAASWQRLCIQTQRNFIEQYVYAKAGDSSAMGSTAASFEGEWRPAAGGGSYSPHTGIPMLPVEACAWRLLRIVHDSPIMRALAQDVARSALDRLTSTGAPLCHSRAEALEQDFRTHPLVFI